MTRRPLPSPHLLALVLSVCLATPLAVAQSSAPAASASTASPAKKELIAKMLQLQQPGVEQLARNILQQPLGALMQGAGAALQQVPADKREAVAKAMEADIKKFVDDNAGFMKERALKIAPGTTGALLDERFTEDELRQLVAWFESPVNKKFAQVGGELQKALADKLLAEVGPTLDGRFKTLQASLAKHLGLPAQGSAPASGAAAGKPAAAAAPAKK